MNLYHKVFRKIGLLTLFAMPLFLAACATTGGGSGGGSAPGGFAAHKLAYGLSIAIPQDWQVQMILDPAANTKQSLDPRIASEGGVVLFGFTSGAVDGQNPDAMGRVAVLEYTQAFPPENVLLEMPPEQFTQWASLMLERAKEAAAKNNQASPFESVHISRVQIDGKNALAMRHKGKGPQGDSIVSVQWYIYLPNNKLAQIYLAGGTHVPGMETLFEQIAMSVRIQ